MTISFHFDKPVNTASPPGRSPPGKLQVERIRSAMHRAQELSGDAAEALEAGAAG